MTLMEHLVSEYRDELPDIARYGCGAGFHGLTYTRDINEFHDKFAAEIWEIVASLADDFGQSVLAFLAGANAVGGVDDLDDIKQLATFIAVEHLANYITECEPSLLDDEDEDEGEGEDEDEDATSE
mgnify:FL=1